MIRLRFALSNIAGVLSFSFSSGRQPIAFTQPRATLQGSSTIYTIAGVLSFSSGRQPITFTQPRATLPGSSTIYTIAGDLSLSSG